jgi:prepilin-type N-terminal cleavage/methylation domain-containing protein
MGSHDLRATLLAAVAAAGGNRRRARGFTLIELLIVVAILGIFLTIGMPALSEFVADQRVRTVTSNIVAEIALARAKAIETSSRVIMEPLSPGNWNNGWRIHYIDINNGNADTELKRFEGFAPGNVYTCSTVPEFVARIVFRPDGRVVRTTVSADPTKDGIYVVDLMYDTALANPKVHKIRGILFGLSGRTTVLAMNGKAPPC